MKSPPEPLAGPPPVEEKRSWERWIRGIGIGVFMLAALGFVSYVVLVRKAEPDLSGLTKYTFFFIIVTFILIVLDRGRSSFEGATSPVKKWFATTVSYVTGISFIVVALLFLVWVGAFVGRDIGALPPVRVEPTSYLLRPGSRVTAAGISYDPKTILRRIDSRSIAFHPIQDPSHLGKLYGMHVEFGPGEDEVDADLILPYEVEVKPHRVHLSRITKTFDFVD